MNWFKRRQKHLLVGVIVIAVLVGLVGMVIDYRSQRGNNKDDQLLLLQLQAQIKDIQERLQDLKLQLEVAPPELPELKVERRVRFVGGEWTNGSLEAKSSQRLEFLVEINSTAIAHNVWVKAKLPDLIFYKDNLKVDGVAFFGDITKGVNVGSVTPCGARNISFEGQVATGFRLPVGQIILLVVPVKVWADCVEADIGEITIIIQRLAPRPSVSRPSASRPPAPKPPPDICPPGGPAPDPP